MKTVLAPGAPWPNWKELSEQPKEKKQLRPKQAIKPLAIPSNGLDFFAEAREQIASGAAKRNPSYYRKKDRTV
jgi:hypothetical protein